MELKYLNTFRTVVETGSFRAAAEKLNYTQSAITFQMGQLEQELSVKLFEKSGRNMVLTQAGELLVPYVDEVFQSVEKLRYFENDLADCQGSIHIGAGETLLCYKIPTALKKFCQQAPKAQIYLRSMNCYDIRNELLRGSLDLGIFYEDIGGFGSSLITYPIGDFPLVLVASPETRRRFPDFVTPDQTLSVPLVINEPTCVFRQIFEEYLRRKSITLDHTIEMWSIPTIKNLVKSDVGISYLPEFTVREELEAGELEIVPTEISHNRITAVCAHNKNKWISPLMRMMIGLSGSIA